VQYGTRRFSWPGTCIFAEAQRCKSIVSRNVIWAPLLKNSMTSGTRLCQQPFAQVLLWAGRRHRRRGRMRGELHTYVTQCKSLSHDCTVPLKNGVPHLVHCKCSPRNDASALGIYITTVLAMAETCLNMDISRCTLDGSPMGGNTVFAPQ
jgi:hypothetical protein